MFGEYTKSIGRVLVIFGAILSVFFFFKTVNEIKTGTVIGRDSNPSNIITVNGKGEVFANPDIANVTFSVIENAKTVAAAQKLATDRSNKAIAFLREKGIAEKDISTQNYSFYPKYEYSQGICTPYGGCPDGKQILTGYEVSQTVSVKIRKIDIAGEILSGLGTIGVQNLSGLDFTVDKRDALEREARQKAITDATQSAEQLASDLGVRIVRIVSFQENNGGYPVFMYSKGVGGADARAESATPELPTGQSKITSNVTIVYEIR